MIVFAAPSTGTRRRKGCRSCCPAWRCGGARALTARCASSGSSSHIQMFATRLYLTRTDVTPYQQMRGWCRRFIIFHCPRPQPSRRGSRRCPSAALTPRRCSFTLSTGSAACQVWHSPVSSVLSQIPAAVAASMRLRVLLPAGCCDNHEAPASSAAQTCTTF